MIAESNRLTIVANRRRMPYRARLECVVSRLSPIQTLKKGPVIIDDWAFYYLIMSRPLLYRVLRKFVNVLLTRRHCRL